MSRGRAQRGDTRVTARGITVPLAQRLRGGRVEDSRSLDITDLLPLGEAEREQALLAAGLTRADRRRALQILRKHTQKGR